MIEGVNGGDLIKVVWLDASEHLRRKIDDPEAITSTYGIFLSFKGRINKHLILINEYVYFPEDNMILCKFICIPSKMILRVKILKNKVIEDSILNRMISISKKYRVSSLEKGIGFYEKTKIDS